MSTKHGFGTEAVRVAWNALQSGGSIAHFDHPERGGHGRLMPSMLMIGNMFNQDLKARVDQLFRDLAKLPVVAPMAWAPAPLGSESVSPRHESAAADTGKWYPSDLGAASSTGSQNQVRYAYFPDTRRLAIELHGQTQI